jgi:hypothetical protein
VLLADSSNQKRVFFFRFFVGGQAMTLLETEVSECTKEFTENYRRKEHLGTFENQELVQTESDFHKIVLDWDPYCALRFLRK